MNRPQSERAPGREAVRNPEVPVDHAKPHVVPAPVAGEPRKRRIGRPLEMSPDEVLHAIRERAKGQHGLFRVHLAAPGLYARARRLFGSWSAAVRLAGVDYEALQAMARVRSLQTRRHNRRAAPGDRRPKSRPPE